MFFKNLTFNPPLLIFITWFRAPIDTTLGLHAHTSCRPLKNETHVIYSAIEVVAIFDILTRLLYRADETVVNTCEARGRTLFRVSSHPFAPRQADSGGTLISRNEAHLHINKAVVGHSDGAREARMNHPVAPLHPPSFTLPYTPEPRLPGTPPWTNYTYRQSGLNRGVERILPLTLSLPLVPSLASSLSPL